MYSASASRDIVLPERSAATVLMQSAKEVKWPEMNFKTAEKYQGGNGDKQLYDGSCRVSGLGIAITHRARSM